MLMDPALPQTARVASLRRMLRSSRLPMTIARPLLLLLLEQEKYTLKVVGQATPTISKGAVAMSPKRNRLHRPMPALKQTRQPHSRRWEATRRPRMTSQTNQIARIGRPNQFDPAPTPTKQQHSKREATERARHNETNWSKKLLGALGSR